MKRIADFLVNKKYLVLIIMLALTVLCGVLAFSVKINVDMTKYLPDDSSMKQGIDVMADEFSNMRVPKTVRVMFKDMSEADCEAMLKRLEDIEYVSSVAFNAESTDYYKDRNALFILSTDYDYGSKEERSIEATVERDFNEHGMLMKNDDAVSSDIPPISLIVAVVLIFIVLIIMCASWLEPILYLAAIGCAVVINLGTNCIFESISYITFAIGALLQLVLSMDYSVILMTRYRQELEIDGDKPAAMKRAVANAFSSITSSSVTTFVGLLALVFMSFKIGKDIGFVLAKGVLCSLICVFTVLPALILLFEKPIEKTAKKALTVPMGAVAKFSYKSRYILAALFIPLFIGTYFLQQNTDVTYTLKMQDPIAEYFPKTSTLVILYSNEDEAKIAQISEELEKDEKIQSVLNYSTTLGKTGTVPVLSKSVSSLGGVAFDESLMNIVYYMYFDGSVPEIPVGEFMSFIKNDVAQNKAFSDYIDDSMRANLDRMDEYSSPDALNAPQSPGAIAARFGMSESDVAQLMLFYKMQNGGDPGNKITAKEFIRFVSEDVMTNSIYLSGMNADVVSLIRSSINFSRITAAPGVTAALLSHNGLTSYEMAQLVGISQNDMNKLYWLHIYTTQGAGAFSMSVRGFVDFLDDSVLSDPQYSAMVDAGQASQLKSARRLIDNVASGVSLDPESMASVLGSFGTGLDKNTAELLYIYYASTKNSDPAWELSILDLFNFVAENMVNDERFAPMIPHSIKAQIDSYSAQMQDGVSQLVGREHSIFTLYSWYPNESEETTKFIDGLTAWCDENLSGDYYIIGDAAMSCEMQRSFGDELLFMTILTAAAIFLVVLVTFRNILIPLILVLLVQCGVYLTVAFIGWQGYSIYYLALIIVQCILMGATIDYGILITDYYRENRASMGIRESIKAAYEGSISTVLTSGSIMVLVCQLVAPTFGEPTVDQICRTISIGAFCAILLIVFFLPGLLGSLDRLVCKKGERYVEGAQTEEPKKEAEIQEASEEPETTEEPQDEQTEEKVQEEVQE